MARSRDVIWQGLGLALPVMLAYLSIGIPCGVMEAQVGFTPLMAFLFSATYCSGAGQFMVSGLWLAGSAPLAIATSVSLLSSRQLLYSTALAPHLANVGLARTLLFSSTVTDETFGINLDRFGSDEGWDVSRGLVVNLASMLAWASANAAGAVLGTALELPVDVMSFGMTAIFICLLAQQRWGCPAVAAAVVSAVAVVACRAAGLGGTAIFVGALVGIAAGAAMGEVGECG